MAGGTVNIASPNYFFSNAQALGINVTGTFTIGASYSINTINAFGFSSEL